jgi:hypothetical protein
MFRAAQEWEQKLIFIFIFGLIRILATGMERLMKRKRLEILKNVFYYQNSLACPSIIDYYSEHAIIIYYFPSIIVKSLANKKQLHLNETIKISSLCLIVSFFLKIFLQSKKK